MTDNEYHGQGEDVSEFLLGWAERLVEHYREAHPDAEVGFTVYQTGPDGETQEVYRDEEEGHPYTVPSPTKLSDLIEQLMSDPGPGVGSFVSPYTFSIPGATQGAADSWSKVFSEPADRTTFGADNVSFTLHTEDPRKTEDVVNRPAHYTAYKGIEVIQLTEQLNFNRGNAVKYIARAGLKDPDTEVQDLEKAAWYLNREIARIKGEN